MKYLGYALWSFAAGALIPVMAVLNARLGRALGEPVHAAVVLFMVGLVGTSIASLALTGRLPSFAAVMSSPSLSLAGGVIVAFYVVSITLLAPRFGVGNAVLFVVTAQVFTSAAIDHFGLFGAVKNPMTVMRMAGLALLIAGVATTQLATLRHPAG